MAQLALVVFGPEPQDSEVNLTKILELFGVPWQNMSAEALLDHSEVVPGEEYCILAAMPLVAKTLTPGLCGLELPPILRAAESLFLFGGDCSKVTQGLVQWMCGSESPAVIRTQVGEIRCRVSNDRPDLCGPLSGLEVSLLAQEGELAIAASACSNIEPLISCSEGILFAAAICNGTRCYLAPCPRLIDIERSVEKAYFDIAEYFTSAVPVVMYLRHAFREVMFVPAEYGACVILDDPVLKPRYGCVDFSQLAVLTAEHRFTCSIAFIPGNWRRTRLAVAKLLKRHSSRLSICVHGCEHTGGEFGARSAESINFLVKLAKSRMEDHRIRTGVVHDAVMVFPQGVFSAVSLDVLKHCGLVAAVNTEVTAIDQGTRTAISEIWGMAILTYWDFGIYTRRYPFHGLHNFAFDLLLGKPCLIVTHHGDFRKGGRALMDFVDRLNRLRGRLVWRTVGEVIRRAFVQRVLKNGTREVRMFGNEVIVENTTTGAQHVIVEKWERFPEGIDAVEVAGHDVVFASTGRQVRFSFDLGGQESALIRVVYKDVYGDTRIARSLVQEIKLIARRTLCELRDEVGSRALWAYSGTQKLQKLVKRWKER